MTQLELRFLGGLEVIQDGEPLPLPPSKKTRALLAYLALNDREFRRERLSELLWEIPDDPRGSLRWSLSKLRRLVDTPEAVRIDANRASVRFNGDDVSIDVIHLRDFAENRADTASVEELEMFASTYRDNFLEGMELSNFHTFHAWYVATREEVTRWQVSVLRKLVDRLADDPQKAITYARQLVSVAPYDDLARARLITLLRDNGFAAEAEQQYQLGKRLLEEIGKDSGGVLFQAFHGPPKGVQKVRGVPAPQNKFVNEGRSALVGRDKELTELGRRVSDSSLQARANVVFIEGTPGIGKSRLLEATNDMVNRADVLVLQASAFESEAIRPFSIWLDALRKLHTPAVTDIFARGESANREAFFDGLSDFVRNESGSAQVLLLFDDLQWCDESSAAALHYVIRMNQDLPLMAVLAGRTDEVRDNAAVQKALQGLRRDGCLTEIKLDPLTTTDIQELIQCRAPNVDGNQLSAQCGGNPLLAIELARAQSSGDRTGSLKELVRDRLSRFGVDGEEIMQWASVMSARVSIENLNAVTGIDRYRISDILDLGEDQAILVRDGHQYRFTHDLVMQSIYTDIPPARRQIMHRRIAEILEKSTAVDIEQAADLSYHAAQSGDSALAARAMVSAARMCLRFFANDDAKTLAQNGLKWADQLSGSDRVKVAIDLHDVLMTASPIEDWQAAEAKYVELAEQAIDHGAFAHARLGYHMASYLHWAHDHWSGAREQTLQAERVVRGGSVEEHIIGLAEAAKCLAMIEQDLSQADAMLMEAASLAQRQRASHHAIPTALGILRFYESNFAEAEELFREARTLCKAAGDRISEYQTLEYTAMIEIERGNYHSAQAMSESLQMIGDKIREGSEGPFAKALTALCMYAQKDDADSFGEAMNDLRVADAKHRIAYLLNRAALIDVERGYLETAACKATEALEYAELLERSSEVLVARVVLAQVHKARNETQLLDEQLQAIAHLGSRSVARWAKDRAEQLLR